MQDGKTAVWTFKHSWKIDVTFRDSGYNPAKEFSLSSTMEEIETYSSYLLLWEFKLFIRPSLTMHFMVCMYVSVYVNDCVCMHMCMIMSYFLKASFSSS